MLNKKLALIMALILGMTLFFTGCSKPQQTTDAKPAEAEKAAPEKVVLKLSSVLPQGNPTSDAMHFFAEKVKEKTNGEVEVQVFDNSQLGGQRDALEGMQVGTMDIAMASAGPAAQFVPSLDVLSLPYIFKGTDHMFKALDGKAGEVLKKDIEENGFQFLTWFNAGSRNLINDTKAITKPEDLKGMKIRVMNSNLMVDTLNKMGAIATPMEQGEVYSALQQGVLDGWENNPVTLLTLKLYEVSDYFSWTQHFMVPDILLVSQKVFEKLTPEQQKAMLEAGKEAGEKQNELWNNYITTTVDQLKEKGVKFNEIDDLTPFAESVKPVWKTYTDKFGTELVDLIESAK